MALKNASHKDVIANTDPLHYLTDQQRIFVAAIVKGATPTTAARQAGYAQPEGQARMVLKGPKIQAAIKFSYERYAKAAQMTRQKVMDGLLDAISMAKIQADAGTMVAGWREIGRMCGFYAPEVKKIDISITTRRVVDQLETLSDDDLLKLVDDSAQIIEGEAQHVLGELDEARESAGHVASEHFEAGRAES